MRRDCIRRRSSSAVDSRCPVVSGNTETLGHTRDCCGVRKFDSSDFTIGCTIDRFPSSLNERRFRVEGRILGSPPSAISTCSRLRLSTNEYLELHLLTTSQTFQLFVDTVQVRQTLDQRTNYIVTNFELSVS